LGEISGGKSDLFRKSSREYLPFIAPVPVQDRNRAVFNDDEVLGVCHPEEFKAFVLGLEDFSVRLVANREGVGEVRHPELAFTAFGLFVEEFPFIGRPNAGESQREVFEFFGNLKSLTASARCSFTRFCHCVRRVVTLLTPVAVAPIRIGKRFPLLPAMRRSWSSLGENSILVTFEKGKSLVSVAISCGRILKNPKKELFKESR